MSQPRSYSLIPRKRNWNKVIQPLMNYQRKENGFDFSLDLFSQIEKMLQLGYQINLNIPYTLTGAHDNFLQTTFAQQINHVGSLKLIPSFSKNKFQFYVEKSKRQLSKKVKNKQFMHIFEEDQDDNMSKAFVAPFVVLKQKRSPYEVKNFNKILSSYQCKKVNTIDANQILQGYVFSKFMQASITRYFYYKDERKNVAYKVDNYENFLAKSKDKKLWKVQQRQQYSCHFVKIMHENKSFETQTNNLIKYLQKFCQKGVERMVTDWIIDTNNRYYLIDLKQLSLIQKKKIFKIQRSLSQLLSTVTCCMCFQACNQSQITKILTNKLIMNFYEHLKKRGINLSFKINFKKIQNFCKVCDLCYNIVVAEAKLIQTQRKISQICHFESQTQRNYKVVYAKKQQRVQKQLHQWRLFFYLEDIKNFSLVFPQIEHNNNPTILHLKLQVIDSITTFQIKATKQNNLPIKMIKVQHILFQNSDIKNLLQKTQIRVQICTTVKPLRIIAEGCIRGVLIQNEQQNLQQLNLQRNYKQMLLFNQNSKYCILGLYVGQCNDGVRQVNLLQMIKSQDIYKPHGESIYCQSLPSEWMQIIDQNYCVNSELAKQQNMLQNKQKIQINDIPGKNTIKQNRSMSQSKIVLPSLKQTLKISKQTKPRLVL